MLVIARSEVAPALRKQLRSLSGAAVLADTDSLNALKVIARRRPAAVVLDPLFAATARGASLIAHVRADRHLAGVALRILVEDEAKMPVLLTTPVKSVRDALSSSSRPLERCGTRRAPRFPIAPEAGAQVDGHPSRLMNLSASGAQVLSELRLQPAQGVELTLIDERGETPCRGHVAWSTLQGSASGMVYRAGLEFLDQDAEGVEAFCLRYGTTPDRVFVQV